MSADALLLFGFESLTSDDATVAVVWIAPVADGSTARLRSSRNGSDAPRQVNVTLGVWVGRALQVAWPETVMPPAYVTLDGSLEVSVQSFTASGPLLETKYVHTPSSPALIEDGAVILACRSACGVT